MKLSETDGSYVSRRSFYDEDVFQIERDRVLRKTWQYVAHESEIARSGDYVTRKLVGDEVIVSRDRKGIVRVLLNNCRHRGVKLCAADRGNASHFRCGYHGWTFANTGELRGVPHAAELYPCGIDKSKLGLVEARCEIYQGLIFATFNADAVPLKEMLGDMAWHMDTVFGRFEWEVYGPPVRTVGHFNWKAGAENWNGDLYHGEVTHKSVIDAGLIFDMNQLLESLGDLGGEVTSNETTEKLAAFVFNVDGGHGGISLGLPHKYERPVFLGYDPSIWAEAIAKLTPSQQEYSSGRTTITANVFPNFSFSENALQHFGDDLPPTSSLNVRLWYPLSANSTEIFSWTFVPKNASSEWKARSQTALARSLNPGGMLDLDDFHNWNGAAEANQGPEAMALFNDYSSPVETEVEAAPYPGKMYPGALLDVNFRSFYQEWSKRMRLTPEAQ